MVCSKYDGNWPEHSIRRPKENDTTIIPLEYLFALARVTLATNVSRNNPSVAGSHGFIVFASCA